jgi:uncharacterized protein YndB with AHSA1/START domain
MNNSPSSRQFETRIDLAASRDVVWNAISGDAELRRWFAPDASVEGGVGGEITWSWKDLHTWPQKIEVWEPGKRLRTRYDSKVEDGEGGRKPLFIDFQLEGEGGRTTLRLVHSGFGPEAAFDAEYDGIGRGWPVELRSLRLYLEHHLGQNRQVAWSTRAVELDGGLVWQRLTGPGGLACGTGLDRLSEGQPFRFRTPDGDEFAGTALCCHEREFSGLAASHGDGFLRFTVERCGGGLQVWIWLATYGEDPSPTRALQARWDAMLERLFPAAVAAPRGV